MITKEKRAEYSKRYREKHPDKCRESYQKWYYKQKNKELKEKVAALEKTLAETEKTLSATKDNLFATKKAVTKAEYQLKKITEKHEGFKDDVKYLLRANVKTEDVRANSSKGFVTHDIHVYAKSLCETILTDVLKIEGKYIERGENETTHSI